MAHDGAGGERGLDLVTAARPDDEESAPHSKALPVLQARAHNPDPVDETPIGRAQIVQFVVVLLPANHRVLATHGRIGESEFALGARPDQQPPLAAESDELVAPVGADQQVERLGFSGGCLTDS
jgi:hypothetical protein